MAFATASGSGGISCGGCVLRPKEDGGRGGCTRTTWYPILKERKSHDCPLFRRQPTPRPKQDRGEQGELF